jgi:hypothetical protein
MSIYSLDHKVAGITEDFNIEADDPSFNDKKVHSFEHEYKVTPDELKSLFFSTYGIDYIADYFEAKRLPLRVVTHPVTTNTCFEKADILGGWDPLNIIKAFYFEYSSDGMLYVAVIPETGCFIDKDRIKDILALYEKGSFIKKAEQLPQNMSPGTCSPFIIESDLIPNGGRVAKILFDTETLVYKKNDQTYDDFSFGLDHRMSVQMNYYNCYRMLKYRYPDVIDSDEILSLSFKEKFVRSKGKIKINYEFNSLNYKTAKFINCIHGYGDVTLINDFVDELDLPEVLTQVRA